MGWEGQVVWAPGPDQYLFGLNSPAFVDVLVELAALGIGNTL